MLDRLPLILACLLALYVACNLGANDVANSMGTSVGSKAITLRQALIIAGILEFTGAIGFGQRVSQTLISGILDPAQFITDPIALLLGMTSALLACGLWLQIATRQGWPVASSHAIVGATVGFGCISLGFSAVRWSTLGMISLTWILTPIASGTIAALFYSQVRHWILNQPNPIAQLQEWLPWLSALLVSVFGVIVLPPIVHSLPIALPLPDHDLPIAIGAMATVAIASWRTEAVEAQMARLQLLSACCVAFAHGSNDVGNAVAPLAAIVAIAQTHAVPTEFAVPLWILAIGGAGIVLGLAVWGKNVIATIGSGIIPLQPSSGFCAELATATTILLASRFGLPVSTSHALVGAVAGVGLVQRWYAPDTQLDRSILQQIVLAWVLTVPAAAGLAIAIFLLLRQLLLFF
ncbi:inorganic phosphate transporter [Microcoleus sp. FACHB-1515]|uniref:inorganic phosphate transporter n=1 Tax=Cyanophyceae TaxID=3028117 RepID=UPI00168739B9|nr:inorganic phosphate transporter [Microcoleus sp. FACHB-1515]MBD2091574.1 inorganic phosphate transporter [Microcoleus sp. FACHB-1515]